MKQGMALLIHDLQDSQMFALAQAAGRAGLPVQGLASAPVPWAQASRYVQDVRVVPSLGDVVESIYALNLKKAGVHGVWLPCVDDIAMFTAHFQDFLQSRGLKFLVADEQRIEQSDLANLHGSYGALHIPHTAWLDWQTLSNRIDELAYPLILKSARGQFQVFQTAEQLASFIREVGDSPFQQRVQQFIGGDVSRMATVMLLFDEHGCPVRGFTGRRLQVARTQYGSFGETLAAKAEWLPELYEGAVALLQSLSWRGFAEVECKQGEDGRWYVLEINPRLSGWLCLAEADGAGFLQAYYQMCAHGSVLEEACLQQSKAAYVRLVAAGHHTPAWHDTASSRADRGLSLCSGLWKVWRNWPKILPGAMDKQDMQASWAILKDTMRRFL